MPIHLLIIHYDYSQNINDHIILYSWWTKRGQGRFFSGFLPFSPTTNYIPPFLHPHLIHFVSFQQPLWWCVRRGRPAPLLFTDLQSRGFIASHPSSRPCVGHKLRIFIYHFIITQVIFRRFFSVGIRNDSHEIDIINIFTERNVAHNWGCVSDSRIRCIYSKLFIFAVQGIMML